MLSNVRTALRTLSKAVELGDVLLNHFRKDESTKRDNLRKLMRQAIAEVGSDEHSWLLFKEQLRAHHSETSQLLTKYRSEMQAVDTWLRQNKLDQLEQKQTHIEARLMQLKDPARMNSPALHARMDQIAEVVREARKQGLTPPVAPYEQDPASWISFLSMLNEEVKKDNSGTISFMDRFLQRGSGIQWAARNIERRTREGFPTSIAHVLQSLRSQQALVERVKEAQDESQDLRQRTALHQQYVERNEELTQLGETGFLVSHANIDDYPALVAALGGEGQTPMLKDHLNDYAGIKSRLTEIQKLQQVLQSWCRQLFVVSELLNPYEHNMDDYEDHVSELCSITRRGATSILGWFEQCSAKYQIPLGIPIPAPTTPMEYGPLYEMLLKTDRAVTYQLGQIQEQFHAPKTRA